MERLVQVLLPPLLVLECVLQGVLGESCWKPQIERCESHIQRHVPRANIKYYNAAEMSTLCRALPSYLACVDRMMPFCQNDKRQELMGRRMAYEYQCTAHARDIMAETHECFRRPEVQQGAKTCKLSYQTDVNSAGDVSRKCNVVNLYLGCIQEKISDECGQDGGDFVRNFTLLSLQPQYEGGDCDLGGDSDLATDHASLPATWTGAGTGLLMITVVVRGYL